MPDQTADYIQTFEQLPEDQEVDIVIVGAGVAGLYTAWKILCQQTRPLNIAIVERLNRTGGRLDTDLIRIGDSVVRDEEGGMRFTEAMKELYRLIDDLGLQNQIVPFPLTDPNDRYYVRGESFSFKEANLERWSSLYNLAPCERGKSPGDILTDIYNRLLKANGQDPSRVKPTPEFWQTFRLSYQWNGETLNKWQLWGLMRNMGYSEQCVTMLSHTLGFLGPFLSLANAGEAFQILEDFPANAKFHTFKDGYSILPNALADGVGHHGGKIYLSSNVDTIHGADGNYRLEMTQATAPGTASSPFPNPGADRKQIRARRVVLAVASKALRTLYTTSPALHQQGNSTQLWANLSSVQDMRLMKINQYYDHIWWPRSDNPERGHLLYGHSFSDTALGSVYPFYALNNPEESPAALTIYCDFYNTDFWQGLQNIPPLFDSKLQRQHSRSPHSRSPQVLFAASQAVVEETTRQFQNLFNVSDIPAPVLTSFRNWDGQGDFGYAYHQWGLNANDEQVMEELVQPVPGVFTCNESYSDMQGWVNGSLRSADRMLKQLQEEL